MLGDSPLLGTFVCKIDDKGRIFLPSSANSDVGDEIFICRSIEDRNLIDLYPLEKLRQRIEKLDDMALMGLTEEVRLRAQNLKKELFSSIIVKTYVRKLKRVALSKEILGELGYNLDVIYGLGEMEKIKLFTSEECFKNYTGFSFIKHRVDNK